MKKSIHIDVTVDGDEQEIVVTDDAGNKRVLKGIFVTGAEMPRGAFYLFAFGSSDEVGYALGRAFREAFSEGGDIDAENAPFYRNIFRVMAKWIGTFFGWDREHMKVVTPREIFEQWDKEDKIKAAIELGERLNGKKRDN